MINQHLPIVESVRWKDLYFSEIHCYSPFSLEVLVRHTHNYLRGIFWEDFHCTSIRSHNPEFPTSLVFDNGKTHTIPFVGYRGGAGFCLTANESHTACQFSLFYCHVDKILHMDRWVAEHPWKERLEELGSPPKLTDVPKALFDLYAATFPGGLFALKRYYT